MHAPLALLLLVAPAPMTGLYETHQMEVAAAIELKANGRFRYALSYGAVDEEAEGDWAFDGKTIRLTSNPMPRAPSASSRSTASSSRSAACPTRSG